ncbi:hypothetical protein [Pseudophaeobacter sp.]|uniref:hypothetical protein n=1 Tax=Pseudophaeobacter sp. TaxID=1971739 RepID=UPI0032974820
MSKLKEAQNAIEVQAGQLVALQMLIEAMIVGGIRTKTIDEKEFIILLDQGMKAFQNNTNMTDQETFGAIGTLTSAVDMIKRAKDKQILP